MSKRVQELEKERNQVSGTIKILGPDSNLNSESKSEPVKKSFPSSNCKEKEQLTAKSIQDEKVINHETTEVVDETLEESDNQSELVVENKIEAMNTDLTNSEVANHVGRAKRSKFKCKACGKNFSSAFGVKRHISSVHEKKKPFSCDKCQKCFALKDELRKHRESVHKETTYPCTQCDKVLDSNITLTRHIKTVHEEQRINICEEMIINNEITLEQNQSDLVIDYQSEAITTKATNRLCSRSVLHLEMN